MAGICLRGKPGWGDLGASFTTVLNTMGGTWWSAKSDGSVDKAMVDQPEFKNALQFYVDLVKDAGEKDAAGSSFNECLSQYKDSKVAMWYDATVAAGLLEADDSAVKGKNGYALAPVEETPASGWLWSWALAIPVTSEKADLGWEFISFATGPRLPQGGRLEDPGRMGRHPARHPQVDLRDPGVQEGRRRVRAAHARRDLGGADRQSGHDQATGPSGRPVRRHPGVPGRRQPVHSAVLRGDRWADDHRHGTRELPGRRIRSRGVT